MRPLRAILLGLSILSLAACSSTPQIEPEVRPHAERQAEISRYSHWQALGRIGLSSPQETISASLDWQQQGADYAVSLSAALGQGTMYVEQKGSQASLQARGRETTAGHSAELLVLRQLGVRVPLSELAFWLRGLPGTLAEAHYDRYGRLHSLRYEDPDGRLWHAQIKSYRQIETMDLPRTIEVTDGEYRIRVVISDWHLGETAGQLPQGRAKPPQGKPAPRLRVPSQSALPMPQAVSQST